MTSSTITPSQVRSMLLLREEIALLDLRHEAAFATGHPLFAANMSAGRIALEAETRLPRKDVPVVVYDDGEGLVAQAADRLAEMGYSNVRQLDGGLQAWRAAGYEVFRGREFLRKSLRRTGRVRAGTRPHCRRTKSPR